LVGLTGTFVHRTSDFKRLSVIKSIGLLSTDKGKRTIGLVDLREEKVTLWDAAKGILRDSIEMPGFAPRCLAFSPDDRHLAIAAVVKNGYGGVVVKTYDLIEKQAGPEIVRYAADRTAGPEVIAYSPDGKSLGLSSLRGSLQLWTTESTTNDP
jgi:WD40 repeat protein